MVRGGQRKGAGRKSDWKSNAKFEDTTVIRVPKNIKDKVMVVARKLDEGIDINLDSNSKIQDLESKLLSLQSDNELLASQLNNKVLELETQSKNIQELEQENNQLRDKLNNINQLEKQLVTNSKEDISENKLRSLHRILINFQERNKGLKPTEHKTKFKQLMIELDEKFFSN